MPTVKVEQRTRGGRHVTTIVGLEGFGFDLRELDKLASELKNHFACAVSVQEAAVGSTGHELIIQGHVGLEVQAHLAKELGVPQKYLELNMGGKGEKKGK